MSEHVDWKLKADRIAIEFFKSKKNSNCLLELEKLLLSTDDGCVLSVLPVVQDCLRRILSTGILSHSSPAAGEGEDVYRSWLLSRYQDFISHILGYLSHTNEEIQVTALRTLLSLLKAEGERRDENESQNFPFYFFKRIVSCLASDVLEQHKLIKVFHEYTEYHDMKLYLLKALMALMEGRREVSEMFLQNCFLLLYSMKYPQISGDDCQVFAYRSEPDQPFKLKEKMFRKLFSSVWKVLLSHQFCSEFLQRALPAFTENVLPQLQNPCLMTDFLTNAYNKGGALSLLALKGLYLLMDKYNLEYPDFFVKLYALLDKSIVNGKHSSRFFELADLFLSSTHLPAHIVASFAKRLSRLSLLSSTDSILRILCTLRHLLFVHPSLGGMLHCPHGPECNEDPFDMDAADPANSNALRSSLWEIKVLQSHVHPSVCCRARELIAAFPKLPPDPSGACNLSLSEMYRKVRRRRWEEVPLAVYRPKQRRRGV